MLSIWKGDIVSKRPSMLEIATEIATRHGVTVADLKSKSRVAKIKNARLEAYAALWVKGDLSRSSSIVGRFLGGRDHTTVIQGAQAHERRMAAVRIAAE